MSIRGMLPYMMLFASISAAAATMVDSPEVGVPWLYKGLITWAFFWAFLDAYTIGANDVANSFANAVSARTLTYRSAVLIACVFEFVGVVGLGSTVTDSVRKKMIQVTWFVNDPYILCLGMNCVNLGGGTWVLVATLLSMPVSTTHSVIGAILGIGIASFGPSGVQWDWNGFGGVVASWFISPALTGVLAAIFYLATKFLVLKHPDEVAARRGIALLPLYFFFAFGTVSGFFFVAGIPALKKTSYNITVPVSFGVGIFFGLFCIIFVQPWVRRWVLDGEDLPWYTLLYHFTIPKGAMGYTEDAPEGDKKGSVEDGHMMADAAAMQQQPMMVYNNTFAPGMQQGMPAMPYVMSQNGMPMQVSGSAFGFGSVIQKEEVREEDPAYIKWGKRLVPGFFMDVGALREEDAAMHAKAFQAYSRTENMFKMLQLTTCCFFSMAHGANDMANAIAPFATVWMVYSTGKVDNKAEVPIWLLVYGGLALDIGLITLGFYIMDALGNRLTLQSPSRGFCIEISAMFTVMTFSRLGVPVSTTHCISGATAAVGLCNGDPGAVNWKLIGVICFGWLLTCPCAGILTGLLFWAVASAPSPTPGNGFFSGHYHG
eukprot:766541-Hanusia_phi.AAC.1